MHRANIAGLRALRVRQSKTVPGRLAGRFLHWRILHPHSSAVIPSAQPAKFTAAFGDSSSRSQPSPLAATRRSNFLLKPLQSSGLGSPQPLNAARTVDIYRA